VGPWSALLRDDPARLEVELARRGLRLRDLVNAVEDDPEAAVIAARLQSAQARERFAVEWFGDEQHHQPAKHTPRVVVYHAPGLATYYPSPPQWGVLGQLEDAVEPGTEEPGSATREIPFGLVEQAVLQRAAAARERRRAGRRTVSQLVPGLTDWMARQILAWNRIGKPAGLWLDDHDRLCWGPAITPIYERAQNRAQQGRADSPTPRALRLPRL
jgi:hypothetical protein